MAHNDMQVVICKILMYLYECLKAGKTPQWSDLQYNSKLIEIPEAYWKVIISELIRSGFIEGLMSYQTKNGSGWVDNGIHITLKGVEYLEENQGMTKAKDFLGQSFFVVLEGVIAGLTAKI
ncbi:YjcQ family protein [Dubosiella newyorkensis]|uniref:YjcQ family protein n=1 Tax=Dubosiella newyorkensis TaxID=1862672 RepID=UPI002573E962|nr:YjcQ family protein [Dubosiella newyorkensis]